MVSVWFLSSSILLAVLQSLSAFLVTTRCLCVRWGGWVLWFVFSCCGLCASARDVPREEGMILGL